MRIPLFGKIAGIVVLVFGVILGLLWYYQQQGFIKVFPTGEDRALEQALSIDRSKFSPAEGLSEEIFESKISELSELKEKILQNPNDALTWFTFGSTKEFLNDHSGAVAAWERALQLQPLNFVIALNLGNNYQYFIKDWPKAELNYRKALELKPDYTSAYEGLMDLYRYNWKEKLAEYEPLVLQAIAKDSANTLAYNSSLAEFFASQGNDLSKARLYLEKVRSADPGQAQAIIEMYPALK